MEMDQQFKLEFFLDGIESQLQKAFSVGGNLVFTKEYELFNLSFDSTFLKHIYLQKIVALRKILGENNLKDGDLVLFQSLQETSRNMLINCQKQIDAENPKNCPKTTRTEIEKKSATTNLVKTKFMNEIVFGMLRQKTEDNLKETKKQLKTCLECLNFALSIEDTNLEDSNFLQEIVYQIPGIEKEENRQILEGIEDVLVNEMEVEKSFIDELRNIIKSKRKFYPFSFFKNFENNKNGSNLNSGVNNPSNKRKSSVDKYEMSPEKDISKNNKLEKYFKPMEKDKYHFTQFNSSVLSSKVNLSNKFEQYANLETLNNLQSDLSYATFAEKSKSSHVELSLSKQSSLHNGNNSLCYSNYENSRTVFTETNMKKPLNLHYGSAYHNTTAKSVTNYSQMSGGNISEFTFGQATAFKPLNYDSDMNSQHSITAKSRKGINSLLASKTLPVTKKASKVFSGRKKKRDNSVIIEKFKEKCSKGNSNLKKNRHDNTNEKERKKNNFKKIVNKGFYANSSLLDKSPDLTHQKENDGGNNTNKKNTVSRSRSMSVTDDEVLVYQTPIKVNANFGNKSSASPITTRKNLFNLFNQIGK